MFGLYDYAHAYPHTPTRIRMRTHTCSSLKQTEHCRGGLSLETSSSEERLRHAPFLTVLRTHSVSRNFPLPPQRMLASLAAVSVAAGPAPHAHPATSKWPRNQTPHTHAACCTLHRMRVVGILWKSLAVGRAVASARSTDTGRRRPTGAMDTTPCVQNRSARQDAP